MGGIMMKKIVLCALASIAMVAAECPNGCSGNGQCTASEQCVCSKHSIVINKDGNEDNVEYVAFTGADCSQHTCPRGTSWIQVPSKPDPGKNVFCTHLKGVECSDKGICNREKGQCECFPGYTGAACQRTECPNDCSGHGSCQSNIKFAEDATNQCSRVPTRTMISMLFFNIISLTIMRGIPIFTTDVNAILALEALIVQSRSAHRLMIVLI